MNKKNGFLSNWALEIVQSCVLLGVVVGSFLIYFYSGEFPCEAFIVGLVVVLFMIAIQKDNF